MKLLQKAAIPSTPPSSSQRPSAPAYHTRINSPCVTTYSDPDAGLLPIWPPLTLLLLLHLILGKGWVLEPVPNWTATHPKAEAGPAHSNQGPSPLISPASALAAQHWAVGCPQHRSNNKQEMRAEPSLSQFQEVDRDRIPNGACPTRPYFRGSLCG